VRALTLREHRALDVAHRLRPRLDGCAISTGRTIKRETIERLVQRRLLRELPELVRAVDGDGYGAEPERWRRAWELTPRGQTIAALEWEWRDVALATKHGRARVQTGEVGGAPPGAAT